MKTYNGIINSIIASGKIDIIQNKELKSLIASFNSTVINSTQEVENIIKLIHYRLWPSIDGKINNANRIRTYEGFSEFPKSSYTSDYTWFFKSKEMEDIVSNITSWNKTTISDMNILLQTIDKMLYLVNQEIKVDQ